MKQVSEKEKEFLKEIGLVNLLLYVCSDNLSEFKLKKLKTNWVNDGHEKEIIVRHKTNIFMLRCQERISYIYLLVAADQEKFLPNEKIVEDLIKELEIKDILIWRNEFLFNKINKTRVLNIITKLALLNAHIVLIQEKLNELGYSKEEQENIFAMHPLFANTNLLVAAYPQRLNFLDRKKLRDYEEVKKVWVKNNKFLVEEIKKMSW